MEARKTRKRENEADVSNHMPEDEQPKFADPETDRLSDESESSTGASTKKRKIDQMPLIWLIDNTNLVIDEVYKYYDLINTLTDKCKKLVAEKNESELRAVSAELRVDELRELLKAKEDELALLNDKLVKPHNSVAGAS